MFLIQLNKSLNLKSKSAIVGQARPHDTLIDNFIKLFMKFINFKLDSSFEN